MTTSRYKDLLNRLVEMQNSPYYAMARQDLEKAEAAIVTLEKRVKELEEGET
jgi:hypothetical protein